MAIKKPLNMGDLERWMGQINVSRSGRRLTAQDIADMSVEDLLSCTIIDSSLPEENPPIQVTQTPDQIFLKGGVVDTKFSRDYFENLRAYHVIGCIYAASNDIVS